MRFTERASKDNCKCKPSVEYHLLKHILKSYLVRTRLSLSPEEGRVKIQLPRQYQRLVYDEKKEHRKDILTKNYRTK